MAPISKQIFLRQAAAELDCTLSFSNSNAQNSLSADYNSLADQLDNLQFLKTVSLRKIAVK
jgi:hypothetical protein